MSEPQHTDDNYTCCYLCGENISADEAEYWTADGGQLCEGCAEILGGFDA